ncbi:hypothetical protein [Leptospira sp. 'Mane']|uniref:hypothetical protein n=1 Tax=Leptospira sp. 'Mane' TaxID=3387407 RepID=UPI00398A9702
MKVLKGLIVVTLFICFGCGEKSLDPKFVKFDRFYYFADQLRNLDRYGFNESERYQYGKFDSKTATLSLIQSDGSWEFKKILKLRSYKENVFFIDGYEKFFLYAEPPHLMIFIKDKDNIKTYITDGGGLDELVSLDACKKHAEKVRIEYETFKDMPQGQE